MKLPSGLVSFYQTSIRSGVPAQQVARRNVRFMRRNSVAN